jgi:signal transduction histidine kinase
MGPSGGNERERGKQAERFSSILTLMGTTHHSGVAHESGTEEVRREALASLAEEQRALRRVATLVAQEAAPETVFAAVAEEAGRLVAADIATIDRFDPEDMMTVVAVRGTTDAAPAIGSQTPAAQTGNAARVRATGRPSRIDRYAEEISPIGYRSGFRAAVSAPITVSGHLWGAVTVATTKEDEPFPRGTEEHLAEFTEIVAIAIANAEARDELRQVAAEQTALRRVATLVAEAAEPAVVFAAVAEEVGRLLSVARVFVARYDDEAYETVAAWSTEAEEPTAPPASRAGVRARVHATGRPARTDGDPKEVWPELPETETGLRSSAGAPITVEGRLWGVIAVMAPNPLPPGIEHRLADFTNLVATAIANAQAHTDLTASRARIVSSADETRRRIVRDLHDGAQQRLVHTIITLELTRRAQESHDHEAATALVGEALEHAQGANSELRELVHGILPRVLHRGGLIAAVGELVTRMRVPVTLDVTRDRFPAAIEANAYFVIGEALTNVAKHSGARRAEVTARADDGALYVEVRDDGVGGATPDGTGLRGLGDRVAALGGQLEITSPVGAGTHLAARLPRQ